MTRAEKIYLFGDIIGRYGAFSSTNVRNNLLYRNLGLGVRQMIEGFDGERVEVVTYMGNRAVRREYINYSDLPDNILDEILYLTQVWEAMHTGRGRWDGRRWRFGRYENNRWRDGRWRDGGWHGGGWRGGRWHDDDDHDGHDYPGGHGGGHGGHDDGHGGHRPPGHEPGHGGGNDAQPRDPRDY